MLDPLAGLAVGTRLGPVILLEPSALPTSADGPHPRREGFDDGRPRTLGHRDEIKPVARQGERMRLHEQPAP